MGVKAIRACDLFCGSGGFSTGLVRACEQLFPGRELDLVAVNHWQVAIDTHQVNHPGVRHFCADLEHLKPRDAVPGGVLDILLAAPSCTYHSRARGGRPVYDQQRMDPWHVVRWCTDLRVYRLLVENVPEFVKWGPCDVRTGKPIKSREGEYFHAWLNALKAIGMRGEWKILTCADFGDATTRERFFYYGRSDKKALRFPEPTHTRGGETDLLGTREPWRSAAECIDWSRPGTSIFTRKRPLVKNTLSRLLAGAKRNHWPRQHVDALQDLIAGRQPRLQVTAEEAEVIAAQLGIPLIMATGGGGTARGVDRPIPGITTGGHNGATPHFAEPVVMAVGSNGAARPTTEPLPTITTGGASGDHRGNARPHFAQPIIVSKHGGPSNTARGVKGPLFAVDTGGGGAVAEPIIVHKARSEGGRDSRAVSEPAPTITTAGGGFLARPIITPYYGGGSGLSGQSADEPLPAQGTKDRFAVASATIFRVNQGNGRARGITSDDDPLPTLTASESLGIATPTLIRAGHGDDGHSDEGRVLDTGEPLPTVTGSNEIGIAQPFLVPNFGERPGQDPRTHDIEDPIPTIAAGGHIQLARPFLGKYHGPKRDDDHRLCDVADPLGTQDTENRFGLAQPFIAPCTHQDDSNRTRGIDEPLPTLTGAHRGELAVAEPALAEGYYIDILYRMLHWSELARATSFEDEGRTYQFTGTATEITKQIGNAVPIRTGAALCAAALEGA